MKNVLVTGGAGYIGSHCCKELSKRGYRPITLDNLVYGQRKNVRWGDFYHGDIADVDILEKIFTNHQILGVMHFAAYAYVGESMSDPKKYYDNNVRKTITLLNYVLRQKVPYFIFSSSCATYGLPRQIPISENHTQLPVSPYGKTKYMIEEILRDYDTAYQLRFMSLRYFNAAGADTDGETGESHDPETHLIPLILDVAKGRSQAIQVFGNDYDTKDGSCVRDYIHVSDLANAHVLALDKLLKGVPSDFINLGTGTGFSVFQTIKKASNITGKKIPYQVVGRRAGDPAVLVASNEKAERVLGWKPQYTNLDDIIETAWNWHKAL